MVSEFDDGSRIDVEIDPDDTPRDVELTASLERSVPWDAEDREINCADGAAC